MTIQQLPQFLTRKRRNVEAILHFQFRRYTLSLGRPMRTDEKVIPSMNRKIS